MVNKSKKNKLRRAKFLEIVKPEVKNVILNAKEYKILYEHHRWLQNHFQVKICLPSSESISSDCIFASIEGPSANINYVKMFLTARLNELPSSEHEPPKVDNVDLITVSDSKSETESKEICNVNFNTEDTMASDQGYLCNISVSENNAPSCSSSNNFRKRQRYFSKGISNSSSAAGSNEDMFLTTRLNQLPSSEHEPHKVDNVEIITVSDSESETESKKFCGTSHQSASSLSQSILSIDESDMNNQSSSVLSQSVVIVDEPCTRLPPAPDFIPLIKSANQEGEHVNKRPWFKSTNSIVSKQEDDDDDIKIIEEHKEPKLPVASCSRLRPIVIDGSNVAMEHGKTTHCFSVKGLKIVIDYFLNRGHTQVTAFVPKHRKSRNANHSFPTSDVDLLDDLERSQHVVFTPSGRVGGKYFASYDDRFIVKLAASNGGVIVSNDNYRDLLDVSKEFKETIEHRLLQFCFVGDTFMVPDDPLGRKGPTLDEFLCFPPEGQQQKRKKVY